MYYIDSQNEKSLTFLKCLKRYIHFKMLNYEEENIYNKSMLT